MKPIEASRSKPTAEDVVVEIVDEALSELNRRLADIACQTIQGNRRLNVRFMHAVEAYGWKRVNQIVGKHVRDRYDLVSTKKRNRRPESSLLRSHTELEFKGAR